MICILVACALVAGSETKCDLSQKNVTHEHAVQSRAECQADFRKLKDGLPGSGARAIYFDAKPAPSPITTNQVLNSK